jgi:hypothetical protein
LGITRREKTPEGRKPFNLDGMKRESCPSAMFLAIAARKIAGM